MIMMKRLSRKRNERYVVIAGEYADAYVVAVCTTPEQVQDVRDQISRSDAPSDMRRTSVETIPFYGDGDVVK
jgi:hypothetical protein